MKQGSKIISVFMACMIIFSLLSATVFISNYTHHDCSGEDCPICEQLHVTEGLIHRFSAVIVSFFAAFFLYTLTQNGVAEGQGAVLNQSPIRLKVKMQN